MVYPANFEQKVGFDEIRRMLAERCLSEEARERVEEMVPSRDASNVNRLQEEAREYRKIMSIEGAPDIAYYGDLRSATARLRAEGTYMEEEELFALRRSIATAENIANAFNRQEEEVYSFPALHAMAEGVSPLPEAKRKIDQVLDERGAVRDDASPTLLATRRQLASMEGSISRTLRGILKAAQADGLVEKDAAPAIRDGRLVIPVAPAMKRKIKGIVHDESASGKTVFIEPTEVVEANNRVRELEAQERREIIKILKETADALRPHVADIMRAYELIADADMLNAKKALAELTGATEHEVEEKPLIDWTKACHPLLTLALRKQGKKPVPLDIAVDGKRRMLIISGPNAGGKSVCLKTVGLLQYMLQCGLSVPIGESSKAGIFDNIMIDIGDEQSIDNDLSTYSSHLANMKAMMRQANATTLLLIDEFGSGTEPKIGGAIAEAVLRQLWQKGAFAVITTHYHNLKRFADDHEGVANGAMLYDRQAMRPLFQLSIGMPGSSFAIEIARKTGLPEEVIRDASEIVGSEYIESDKYLLDIVRDKRYWEQKRHNIHQKEKDLEKKIERYEQAIAETEQSRKEIMAKARKEAEDLLAETNRRIENTIKDIRECQAEKEETKKIREELLNFRQDVEGGDDKTAADTTLGKNRRSLEARKRREEKRVKRQKRKPETKEELVKGDTVRIKGMTTVGTIEIINGKTATVIFGAMRSKVELSKLERAAMPKKTSMPQVWQTMSKATRDAIEERRLNFKQDIDVRGMRGEEALTAVGYFIDDAILVGMRRVRILHGTGTGALKTQIRQYLATETNVTAFRDENVDFGGAGITVVDIG